MATTAAWTGNAQATAQVATITVSVVATNGVLSASTNGKTISYTCLSTDTTSTAAAAWQALLNSTLTAPPEFQEVTWAVTNNVVTATAATAGVPFAGVTGPGLTVSGTGGASAGLTITTPNSSPSDAANAQNWSRNGAAGLPQNGDDVVVADSTVPILYNLDALKSVQLNSYTRWQNFSGTVGLPEINPNGYVEWRQTYFQFSGNNVGALPVLLGQGLSGNGPGRERYNVGGQQTKLTVLAAGSALDDYAVRFLGSSGNGNAITLRGTSLAVAMLTGEAATVSGVTVDGGGLLALGPGVTFTGTGGSSSSPGPSSAKASSGAGTVTLVQGQAYLYCAPQTVSVQNGSSLTSQAVGLTYGTITAVGGSTVTWLSDSSITTLNLTTGSVFDKSQDLRPIVIVNSTQDGDTTTVLDTNNVISWSNPVTYTNAVAVGPYSYGPGRKVQYT